MTAAQIRAALKRFGLTQIEAAALFGVTERTIRNWSYEGTDGPTVIMLRLMLAEKITVEDCAAAKSRA